MTKLTAGVVDRLPGGRRPYQATTTATTAVGASIVTVVISMLVISMLAILVPVIDFAVLVVISVAGNDAGRSRANAQVFARSQLIAVPQMSRHRRLTHDQSLCVTGISGRQVTDGHAIVVILTIARNGHTCLVGGTHSVAHGRTLRTAGNNGRTLTTALEFDVVIADRRS